MDPFFELGKMIGKVTKSSAEKMGRDLGGPVPGLKEIWKFAKKIKGRQDVPWRDLDPENWEPERPTEVPPPLLPRKRGKREKRSPSPPEDGSPDPDDPISSGSGALPHGYDRIVRRKGVGIPKIVPLNEVKFQIGFISANLGTDQNVVSVTFNSIAQGKTDRQREGREIIMKSVFISGWFKSVGIATSTADDHSNIIKMFIVSDSRSNQSLAPTNTVYVANETLDIRDPDNLTRFKVHYVRRWIVSHNVTHNGTALESIGEYILINVYVNLQDMKAYYSGTGADFNQILKNALSLYVFTQTTLPTVLMHIRWKLRFTGGK